MSSLDKLNLSRSRFEGSRSSLFKKSPIFRGHLTLSDLGYDSSGCRWHAIYDLDLSKFFIQFVLNLLYPFEPS